MPEEIQTCQRRMSNLGPWENKPDLDTWKTLPNGDRTCSFCGSMHPQDLLTAIEKLPETPGLRLEMSDKNYKMYIHRPDIRNAGEGAIKFYMWHVGGSDMAERLSHAYNEVFDLCVRRSEEALNTALSGLK